MMKNLVNRIPVKAAALALAIGGGILAPTVTLAASDMASWQKEVVSLVAKKQVYPRAAMSKEIEGRAKVKVSIDRSGAITNFELLEGTGSDLLDAEVVKLMDRINPMPAPPASMSDDNLTFVLPLAWVLQ